MTREYRLRLLSDEYVRLRDEVWSAPMLVQPRHNAVFLSRQGDAESSSLVLLLATKGKLKSHTNQD